MRSAIVSIDVTANSLDDDFNDLYEAYYRSVLRYALVARGPDEADDIVAETFQKAYLAWAGHGERPRSPLAWLLTIARRTVIDAARRDRRRQHVDLVADTVDDRSILRARETWLWFDAATKDLPEASRQALYMRYAGGLSTEEIGEALSMSASGVRSAISRGLAVVRAAERSRTDD